MSSSLDATAVPQKDVVRVHPQNDTPLVKVELPGLEGTLTLQLPELISDTDRRLAYFFTNLKKGVSWKRLKDGTQISAWEEPGLAAYRLVAKPEHDGLATD